MPRRELYRGEPTFESIRFDVAGAPGPSLAEIMLGSVKFKRPQDHVFVERGSWSRVRCVIDWPNVSEDSFSIPTTMLGSKQPITREMLAQEVAQKLVSFLQANGLTRSYETVRLLGLAYYKRVFVPIIALDH
ncbi:hypothetical protein DXG03_006630 [Asterophora parasitica]|uniref:Uncharacterized protein n=1 Tax=Asterophora parasitica TaxID=117018 RepID=A0A9P7K8B3_9AGAR|nr:hypothetical protein DXG03_006630 [Asterophora parasitica]